MPFLEQTIQLGNTEIDGQVDDSKKVLDDNSSELTYTMCVQKIPEVCP
jgi:hypothetical protein